jgi:hypothetical protein
MYKCEKCGREFENRNQIHSCTEGQDMDYYFKNKKIVWLELYKKIKNNFEKENLLFNEHFAKIGIMWRKGSSFAIFYPKKNHLETSFCCDGINQKIKVTKYMEMSVHRVTHYVAVTNESNLEEINQWIKESYILTQ